MPTRREKEELIIKLLQAGGTYKEISRECHASFSEISIINKKLQGDGGEPNQRNQAYKMFEEEKKTPIDVAIALQIDSVETMKYYNEFLRLKREFKLIEIRNELKDDFLPFVALYRVMKNKKCGIDEIEQALQVVEDVAAHGTYLEFLKAGISKVHEERDALEKNMKELENEISSSNSQIEYLKRIEQLLLVEITSMMRQLYYSQPLKS